MAKMMRLGTVLLLFAAIASSSVTNAARFLSSMPNASAEHMLTVTAGEQITFTCSHETVTANTVWTVSPPVNCSAGILHSVSQPINCPPFLFEDTSSTSPFTSTAVATANVSMTGAVVTCKDGVGGAAMQVGSSITICVIDDPPPPQNLQCVPMSGGIVQCSWDPVLQDCAMDNVSYSLVITDSDGNVTNSTNTTGNMETYALIPGQDYNATIVVFMGDRQSNSTVIEFTPREIVTTMSPTTTTPPPVTTPASPSTIPPTPAPQGGIPSYVWIIIALVAIAFIAGVIIGILLVVFRKRIFKSCCEGEKDNTDGIALKPSSGSDTIKHEPGPSGDEYAVVDSRSKPTEDLGSFYQDPRAIEHEEAPTGDLYAVTEKKPKGSKKGPSEDELAQMYSVPDKSKKNQGGLTYADIDVSGGSGRAPAQQQLDYATVVN